MHKHWYASLSVFSNVDSTEKMRNRNIYGGTPSLVIDENANAPVGGIPTHSPIETDSRAVHNFLLHFAHIKFATFITMFTLWRWPHLLSAHIWKFRLHITNEKKNYQKLQITEANMHTGITTCTNCWTQTNIKLPELNFWNGRAKIHQHQRKSRMAAVMEYSRV